jgi:purine-binding chemotaxis protein CheW
MEDARQFCTFYLDEYLFGIELLKVQEVIQQLEFTEVPLAPYVVRGLLNLRGQIVMGIDLRRQLGLAERAADKPTMNVVVRSGEDAISLVVDDIGDVVEVGEESFEPPPETLRGRVRSVILGVHKLEKQLMHVLDTERACRLEEGAASGASRSDSREDAPLN